MNWLLLNDLPPVNFMSILITFVWLQLFLFLPKIFPFYWTGNKEPFLPVTDIRKYADFYFFHWTQLKMLVIESREGRDSSLLINFNDRSEHSPSCGTACISSLSLTAGPSSPGWRRPRWVWRRCWPGARAGPPLTGWWWPGGDWRGRGPPGCGPPPWRCRWSRGGDPAGRSPPRCPGWSWWLSPWETIVRDADKESFPFDIHYQAFSQRSNLISCLPKYDRYSRYCDILL